MPAILIAAVTVLGLALTISAGVWQWGRAQQKQTWQAQWQERTRQPALRADEVFTVQGDMTSRAERERQWLHRSLVLSGRWAPQFTVYLDNRQLDGRTGFFVLTPFIEQRSGRWLLVQRGWLPRDVQDRSRVPPLVTPDDVVTIQARLATAPSRSFKLGGATDQSIAAARVSPKALVSDRIRQNLELSAFAAEIGHPLWDFLLLQTDPPPGATPDPRSHVGADRAAQAIPSPVDPKAVSTHSQGAATRAPDATLRRNWPEPQLGLEKHLGYAFQWFALASLIVGLYVWFQILPFFRSRRATAQR